MEPGDAYRYADHIIYMKDGAIQVQGSPAKLVTAATMMTVVWLDCQTILGPVSETR
jgi:iron complex transport system ATP-binding protein